jgi:hypothetical protein
MTIPEAPLLGATASLLAQVTATLPDTLLMRQVQTEPTFLQRIAEILRALMTLGILTLTVAVVPAAWNFRKSYKKFSDLLDRVYADINPLTHHASRIAENVDYVTTAIRADVQRASATLNDANQRLQEAVRQAELRAKEFEALLSVVQEEAETTFVSAASAVRGVRTGVGRLRDDLADPLPPRARRRRVRRRLRELAEAAEEAAELEEGADWPADADVVRAELPPPPPELPLTTAAAAPNLPVTPAVAPAAAPGVAAADDLDELEDYYDLEDVHDGEDDRLPDEPPQRPRVRPRRDRRG